MPSSRLEGWVDPAFRPRLDIELHGLDRPLQAIIDTSYRGCLCVHQSDALEAGLILNQGRRQRVERWEHPRGSLMLTFGRIIWFGTQTRVPIFIADEGYGQPDLLPRLGLDLFTDCIITVDFPQATVIISKRGS